MTRTTAIPDYCQLHEMYVLQQKSLDEIGLHYERSKHTVAKWLRLRGIPLRPRGPRFGANAPAWKGGVTSDPAGYILRYSPNHPDANTNGYVREHRLVMEKTIGRRLLPEEVVHHKDENPANNHPDNLELYSSNAEHFRLGHPDLRPSEQSVEALRERNRQRAFDFPDNDALRSMYSTMSTEAMATVLGCGAEAVRRKLISIGLEMRHAGFAKLFEFPDVDRLSQMLASCPNQADLARQLGVTYQALRGHLKQHGLLKTRKKVLIAWPPDDQLLTMHETQTSEEIANTLKCSPASVQNKLKSLGQTLRPAYKRDTVELPSVDELKALMVQFPVVRQLASHLNVDTVTLTNRLIRYGLYQKKKRTPKTS